MDQASRKRSEMSSTRNAKRMPLSQLDCTTRSNLNGVQSKTERRDDIEVAAADEGND